MVQYFFWRQSKYRRMIFFNLGKKKLVWLWKRGPFWKKHQKNIKWQNPVGFPSQKVSFCGPNVRLVKKKFLVQFHPIFIKNKVNTLLWHIIKGYQSIFCLTWKKPLSKKKLSFFHFLSFSVFLVTFTTQ